MKLTTEQLTELKNILDYRQDTMLNNTPPEGLGLEAIWEADYRKLADLTEAVRSELKAQEEEEEEALITTVRLATYTVLTGDTYEVEAHTEAEALERFHDWYGDKDEFSDSVIEEGEALTIVLHHD
jgi:hypothetical protein